MTLQDKWHQNRNSQVLGDEYPLAEQECQDRQSIHCIAEKTTIITSVEDVEIIVDPVHCEINDCQGHLNVDAGVDLLLPALAAEQDQCNYAYQQAD